MDALRLETRKLDGSDAKSDPRQKALETADQFEELFVRTLVQSLRQTATVGGEGGSMFGSGPGSDTYAGWFDQNIAEQLGRNGSIGIAEALMKDMERHGEVEIDPDATSAAVEATRRERMLAVKAMGKGGIDVVP